MGLILPNTYLESIEQDLPSVKWVRIVSDKVPLSEVKAEAYCGIGTRWTHNLIIWFDNMKDQCDGAASGPIGIVIRYTPEIAKQAMQLVVERGLRGGTKEA